jgi:non-heme chloroperoxidase
MHLSVTLRQRTFDKENRMPYFKTNDGTQLFYSVWGEGRPIVFIHGNNVASDMWVSQIPSLVANGHQCIAYDQRGFIRSDSPQRGYDMDTFADDLNCFFEHLNLPQISVVAVSTGCAILARCLSRHGSGRVDNAILISTTTPCFLKSKDNPEGLEREVVYEPFRTGMIKDRPQLFRDSLDGFFNDVAAENPISEGIREWIVNYAIQNPLMTVLQYMQMGSEADSRADMRSFTMPTLIVHGDSDVFAPVAATGLRTHKLIAQSEILLYPGASHGLVFTHRDRLNRDIAQFLKQNVLQLASAVSH